MRRRRENEKGKAASGDKRCLFFVSVSFLLLLLMHFLFLLFISFLGRGSNEGNCGQVRRQSRPQIKMWSWQSVGVVVLNSFGGDWVLMCPPCGRGGSRVVALLRCFSRDGRGGRCSSAGCGGAVALEGRGVYLPWG